MPSLTVENYVKTIFQISNRQHGEPASTGQIASALGVLPGTVTSMLKTLDAARLATHKPYEGVSLTRAGKMLALRMIRRHRLIELFLLRTLDMTWDEVHDEAENMEHAVSDLLVDRIDAFLGFPDVDPHGDPIPRGEAMTMQDVGGDAHLLSDAQEGKQFTLVRVLDQSSEFLRYLTEMNLVLGAEGLVEKNPDGSGLMTIKLTNQQDSVSLAINVAGKIIVT